MSMQTSRQQGLRPHTGSPIKPLSSSPSLTMPAANSNKKKRTFGADITNQVVPNTTKSGLLNKKTIQRQRNAFIQKKEKKESNQFKKKQENIISAAEVNDRSKLEEFLDLEVEVQEIEENMNHKLDDEVEYFHGKERKQFFGFDLDDFSDDDDWKVPEFLLRNPIPRELIIKPSREQQELDARVEAAGKELADFVPGQTDCEDETVSVLSPDVDIDSEFELPDLEVRSISDTDLEHDD